MAEHLRMRLPGRSLRSHAALLASLALLSLLSALIYRLTGGGTPRAREADAPRLNALDLTGDKPSTLWEDDEFECLGWRATHGCDPFGPRDLTRDCDCGASIPRTSGFCEVRNRTSGEVLRVMLSTCKSWRWAFVPALSCDDARQFTDFSVRAAGYEHVAPDADEAARGIAMVAFPKAIAGVYAIVRTLRELGCSLPVELWIHKKEMRPRHSVLQELVRRFHCVVRVIHDPHATKFHAKPYAIYHSRFESVLFLDSDNIPVRDPTYLFDSPEFQRLGAIFWPDFWRPMVRTPFNVHEQSALWRLLDMPFTDMFEQESGQILVNRSRSHEALSKLMFYSAHLPRLITDWRLVYGDKDLFRLAWLNTSTPFHMVQHLPMIGGLYDEMDDTFCGVSMVQRDPAGDILFMHRNQAKLSGKPDDREVLVTHTQRFTGGDGTAQSLPTELDKYRVKTDYWVLGQHTCLSLHPFTEDGQRTPYVIERVGDTNVERQAVQFAVEARALLSDAEEARVIAIDTQDRERRARNWRDFQYKVVAGCSVVAALPLLLLLASRRKSWLPTTVVTDGGRGWTRVCWWWRQRRSKAADQSDAW